LQARNHSLRAISAPGLERVLGRLGTDWAPPSGYVALIEEKVLAYFGRRRVATREYLVKNLGVSENDVSAALDALENRGWIKRGSARVIESPGLGVTILKLTPAGEQELERRRAPSPEDPVQRSRDEVAGTNSPPNSSVGSGGRTNKSRWNPLHTAAAFLLAVDRRVHDHD
jgi:DNA-binding MarR family transcriptional regulator